LSAGTDYGAEPLRLLEDKLKTSAIDYVLSCIAICAILACSVGVVWALVPVSKAVFLSYHVVVDLLLLLLAYGVISALLVRILLKVKAMPAGTFEMDSRVFTYWKLLTVVYRLGQAALLPVTPVFFKPLVEVLYGARIGRDVALGGVIDDPYQVTVGDGTVLGHASLVSGNYLSGGKLICGSVTIGSNVTLGANAVVFPGTEIGDNATLIGGSYVMPGTTVPAGETWRGNPARKWM
jgi:acetyltransferase-like isoleucine patch superfamily enzyme